MITGTVLAIFLVPVFFVVVSQIVARFSRGSIPAVREFKEGAIHEV